MEKRAKDDVKVGPLDAHRVKTSHQKKINLDKKQVFEYATEAEARPQTKRNPVGLQWIGTNKSSAEATRYRLCTEVRLEGVEPIF